MKLKEKLAESYVDTLEQVRVTEFYQKPDIHEVNFRHALQDAYLAGFERNREMVIEALRHDYEWEEDILRLVGEEEV
jgi:hypothetical protein